MALGETHLRLLASANTSAAHANLSSVDDVCAAAVSHGAHPIEDCGGCSGDFCVVLGVAIHIVGSVGINLGQNIQALALSRRPDLKNYPCGSTLWRWGMALFITASIVTFGALALASASILVPLESVQFIVNRACRRARARGRDAARAPTPARRRSRHAAASLARARSPL